MTRAKDISKIVTDADLSGTLDVTGDLTVDTNTLHVDSANNRVGIGTSSPTGKFQVDGGRSYFSANSEAFALYLRYNTSTAGVFVGSPSTDTFTVSRSGGQEHLRIDSSGNVGIGTTSPVGKLDLGATTGVKLTLYPTNYSIGVESNELRIASNQNITFYSSGHSGTERMRIDSSGRVGIGTSSPTQKLQVSGASSQYVSVVSTDSGNTGVLFGDSGQVDQGYVLYANSDDSLRIGTSNTERMRIDSSGNVGIGTSSPADSFTGSSLDATGVVIARGNLASHQTSAAVMELSGDEVQYRAYGATAGTGYMTFNVGGGGGSADSEAMRIESSGRVAIGRSSSYQSAKVTIENNAHGNYLYMGGSTENNRGLLFTSSVGSTGAEYLGAKHTILAQSGGGEILFKNDNYDWLYLSPDGNVGIGNSIPSSFNAGANNLVVGTGSGSEGITIYGGAESNIFFADGTSGSATTVGRIEYSHGLEKMLFYVNNLNAMNIDSSGNLLVATSTSPTVSPYEGAIIENLSNGARLNIARSANAILIGFYNTNGLVGSISTSGSSAVYNTSSDHRLKENVTADWDATTRLKQLNPVRFNFIADADTTVDGFLAHEVQSVVPEAITGTHNEVDADGNPVYQGIDQSKLVPLLVKTIQELEARIVALETA